MCAFRHLSVVLRDVAGDSSFKHLYICFRRRLSPRRRPRSARLNSCPDGKLGGVLFAARHGLAKAGMQLKYRGSKSWLAPHLDLLLQQPLPPSCVQRLQLPPSNVTVPSTPAMQPCCRRRIDGDATQGSHAANEAKRVPTQPTFCSESPLRLESTYQAFRATKLRNRNALTRPETAL